MSSNAAKRFAAGYLPSSIGTANTVGTGKQWMIKSIDLCNTDTSPRTVTLRIIGGSDAYSLLHNFPLAAAGQPGSKYERDWATIVLEAGELIEWAADVANKVSGILSGVEVTL